MEAGKHIPIAAAGVDALPPRRLRQILRPNEQVLWWSRGSGPSFNTFSVVGLALSPLVLATAFWFRLRTGSWAGWDFPFVFFAAVFVAIVLWQATIGARFHIYGLTNQRVLYIPGFPSIFWFGLHRDGGSGGAIHTLHATGGADRGNLRLQTQFAQHSLFNRTGVRLTGIADPVGVAELIKSTLKLPIEVENRTR